VPDGKWGKWLRDDCELSRSTALLYMRLANHQGDIDAARVQLPDLSLRAARRLLTNDHHAKNGNGGAVTILPPTTKVIRGVSLAHRELDAPQLAVLAADVADRLVTFIPSQQQLARLFGVSVPYIRAAQRLSPSQRAAILRGLDPVSFTDLVNPPRLSLAGPMIPDLKVIPDIVLENLARAVGVDRLLAAAIAVEHNI
jgi:hypothetical protein